MQRSVLVVDDEAAIRLSAAGIFEANGFQVRTAASAEEAMETIRSAAFDVVVTDRSAAFDVVVTDLKMETDAAGLEVAEFAAKQPPPPVIIVVSAYPQLGPDWKQRGVHALFEKPTEVPVLLRSIAELLALRDGAEAA